MKNKLLNDEGYSVYPGAYVPSLKDEEVQAFSKTPHLNERKSPAVNVTELPGSYKVQMVIPGVKREEFFIHAKDNVINVCVIHKEGPEEFAKFIHTRESEFECIDRLIHLPENADSAFVSAEYKDGTLCMYAPKSKSPGHPHDMKIVVY
ncbi:MAG: Hsp20/alpha crystallin family protein [Bacteroidota bacterium]